MKATSLLAAGGLALLAAACTTKVSETPAPTPFNETLREEYGALAEIERKKTDWVDGERFAKKANAAGRGEMVLPEPLEAWNLPPERMTVIAGARSQLLAALDGGARAFRPRAAARAQVSFDCWFEREEEPWHPDDLDRCKREFDQAMQRITAPPPPPPAPPVPPPLPSQVFFRAGSTQLDDAGWTALAQLAEDYKRVNATSVTVVGYGDRRLSPMQNQTLAQRRAEAVAQGLARYGVPAASIATSAQPDQTGEAYSPDGRVGSGVLVTLVR